MPQQIPLEDVIKILGLEPLVGEGGLWSQGVVSDETLVAGAATGRDTDRPLYGTIYYLLTPDTFSCMHRLITDEVWYHHSGPAAQLLLVYPDGRAEVKLLGGDLLNGEQPQIMVPRGVWQGCRMAPLPATGEDPSTDSSPTGGIYTLMSTSMAPAYQQSDFEAATFEELQDLVPAGYHELLRQLTI